MKKLSELILSAYVSFKNQLLSVRSTKFTKNIRSRAHESLEKRLESQEQSIRSLEDEVNEAQSLAKSSAQVYDEVFIVSYFEFFRLLSYYKKNWRFWKNMIGKKNLSPSITFELFNSPLGLSKS